ncbi:hypothetical protein HY383_02610 [Candidatus Daviesbacteria bacterium]|nr:hypothetical protein [Candidatus Daviesbacteria bacterium]
MAFKLKNLKYILPVFIVILLIIYPKVQNRISSNCTIVPAVLSTHNIDGSTVNLSWTGSVNSKKTYLNVSTSKSLKPDGSLEVTDIVNDVVTNKNSYSKTNLSPGTYYWNIVIDGCKQRKVSSLGTFTIQSTTNDTVDTVCTIEQATLNEPEIEDTTVTLSWTKSKSAKVTYINISSSKEVDDDGVLQKVDIANDVVTDKKSYTRENLPPGTYYWNIASDGCGQRKMSELGIFTIQ